MMKGKAVILIDKPLPPKQGLSLSKKRAWLMKKAAFCKMIGPFTRSKVGNFVPPTGVDPSQLDPGMVTIKFQNGLATFNE